MSRDRRHAAVCTHCGENISRQYGPAEQMGWSHDDFVDLGNFGQWCWNDPDIGIEAEPPPLDESHEPCASCGDSGIGRTGDTATDCGDCT